MRKLSLIPLLLVTLNFAIAQANLAPVLPGYIIRPADNALELTPLTAAGLDLEPRVIPVESGVWHYLALSPDEQYLALVTQNDAGEFSFEVHDLSQGTVNRLPLPPTGDPEVGYFLSRSPDNSIVVVNPSSLLEKRQIYDVKSGQLTPIPADFVIGLTWLPDETRFLFNGRALCGEPCSASTDLYAGKYTEGNVAVSPITRLDANSLELSGRMTTKYISLGQPTYHPVQQRIYVSLGEDEVNPGGFEFLYSTDFDGNLRFEAGIAALDPESQFPTQIQRMLYSQADSNIYLIVYTDGTGADPVMGRISVLRKTTDPELTPIYSRDFDRVDLTTVLYRTDSRISPDGRYLAIGLSGSVQARKGVLVVLDLITSSVVTEEETSQQVCELFWSEDSSHVIYTQTLESPCVRLKNQPVNQLIAYNLNSRTTSVLVEDRDTPFFFLTGR